MSGLGITFKHKGDFSKTDTFLNRILRRDYLNIVNKYAKAGVNALSSATPKDSGETAASWNYEIRSNNSSTSIIFTNSNINKGVNIAIILQYGHGTKNGGYVEGLDYINPAISPIMEQIAEEAWREVTK